MYTFPLCNNNEHQSNYIYDFCHDKNTSSFVLVILNIRSAYSSILRIKNRVGFNISNRTAFPGLQTLPTESYQIKFFILTYTLSQLHLTPTKGRTINHFHRCILCQPRHHSTDTFTTITSNTLIIRPIRRELGMF